MRLFNIFKKETKATIKSKIQKLDKKQLNKVIGGADESTGDKLPASIRGVVIDKGL